jgi:glycosyltransferase involved in cell wall biosynthesis
MTKTCPVHVLHIASGDLWAGAEAQVYTLARTVHALGGARVSVVVLNHGTLEQRLRNSGIPVSVLDESGLNGFQIFWRLIRTIREIRPDVIHTHRIKENILGSIAAHLCGNIPSLRTAHGAPEHRPAWYLFHKHLLQFADRICGRWIQGRIIAVSEDLARILEQDYPRKNIVVIENGIDIQALEQTISMTSPRERPAGDPFRIGIAGRLVAVKRVDLFVRTARALLDEYPDLKASFHIFGEGPLQEELEALSGKLQTSGIVHFEGHCDNMPSALLTLDILLMTSDHEGLPMILLEAMALQIPIIAHQVGGIPNLLDQGACGLLIKEHSPTAYARAIYQLTANPEKRLNIAHNALERIKTRYSAGQNARYYCREYVSLVQPGKPIPSSSDRGRGKI